MHLHLKLFIIRGKLKLLQIKSIPNVYGFLFYITNVSGYFYNLYSTPHFSVLTFKNLTIYDCSGEMY